MLNRTIRRMQRRPLLTGTSISQEKCNHRTTINRSYAAIPFPAGCPVVHSYLFPTPLPRYNHTTLLDRPRHYSSLTVWLERSLGGQNVELLISPTCGGCDLLAPFCVIDK